jgi:small subunit ribosomal protein S8e
MVVIQRAIKGRKASGGKKKEHRSKRKFEKGTEPALTNINACHIKTQRTRGGLRKIRLFSCDIINVFDPKTKKFTKATITSVAENPSNRHFVRRNVITKGAVVDTDLGKIKVTSRPGQEGSLNGVLLK